MTIDKYTKFIMTLFTFALLLNGLNPWINPTPASAKENSTIKIKNIDSNCFSNNKVAAQTLDGVNNVERLLGYIESSVNDIKLTMSGLDRRLGESPARDRTEKN
jgi:hypothetical protein